MSLYWYFTNCKYHNAGLITDKLLRCNNTVVTLAQLLFRPAWPGYPFCSSSNHKQGCRPILSSSQRCLFTPEHFTQSSPYMDLTVLVQLVAWRSMLQTTLIHFASVETWLSTCCLWLCHRTSSGQNKVTVRDNEQATIYMQVGLNYFRQCHA